MASILPFSVTGERRPPAQVDQSALLLMLSYVEAECRRMGAAEAAQHAAAAAAALPGGMPTARGNYPRPHNS
ncbi:hypothetical protein NON00_18660 [Roseomonas sp. GC11]|uniref:hypothetical protein n=1 Tax=Roseomonas sp. GC11 TaxID=2950546 RepID=UPI00210BD4FA|nr:hypothetical protein [Roseomonas sp. GC11]MCQ4161941.1 hypothetical protein [Roseomonas sp. GC11]